MEEIINRLKNVLKGQAIIVKEDEKIDIYTKVDQLNVIEDLMDVLNSYKIENNKKEENER